MTGEKDRAGCELSPTEKRALAWLAERNSEGAIDRFGKLVAAGERCSFMAETWLRLVSKGLLQSAGPNRLMLTGAGKAMAA